MTVEMESMLAVKRPASWTASTLGELSSRRIDRAGPATRPTFAYIDISAIDNRAKVIRQATTVATANAPSRARQRLAAGDVLVSTVRPNLNAVAMVPDSLHDAVGSTGFHVLRANGVLPKWLFYLVQTDDFVAAMSGKVAGVVYPAIRPKDLISYRVPVAPLSEQRRIVETIEAQFTRLSAAVAALERVRANLRRYRASVLQAACSGELLDHDSEGTGSPQTAKNLVARLVAGRIGRKPPLEPDSQDLPALPSGWTWATLDQLGQPDRPIIYGIIKPGPHDPAGVPYVRVTEMKDGRIDVASLKKANPARAEKFKRAMLQSGDVLISKDGTIGRVAVVPPELAGGNITQHVMRAPIHPLVNRQYVVWAIRSPFCQKWLTGETRGVALRGVNVEDFRRLPIPLPPLHEQARIADEIERRLSVAEALVSEVEAGLKRCARMRQSILKKAFEGTLVEPDPKGAPVSSIMEPMNGSDVVEARGGPNRRARHVPGDQ